MELVVIIFLMGIGLFTLAVRNFAVTRMFNAFIIFFIGILGVQQGIITSNDLLFRPLTSPLTLVAPYTTGDLTCYIFLVTCIFGGLALLFKDAGG